MPNGFAYVMLILWPILGGWIARKRTDPNSALLLFLVPYLILPVKTAIDFPLVPAIDKDIIASIFAFYFFAVNRKTLVLLPKGIYKVILLLLFVAPLMTMLTNRESVSVGVIFLPGLGFSEFINMLFGNIFTFYVPFIIGYTYFRDNESHRLFLQYILIAGLIYSVPILWEIRMSPQLHRQVYGFFPHDFIQMVRASGYRPVVFLGHGLLVSIFIAMALIAAAANWKLKILDKARLPTLLYILFILVICKSWGALIFGFAGLIAVLMVPVKLQQKALMVLALIVFIYPALRMQGWIPTNEMTGFFAKYSEDRARSLQIRFDNEDLLLDHAAEKSLFGWGVWGRSRLYNPRTGEDAVITDGSWVISFGVFGWLGYLLFFGLLSLPIIQYGRMKNTGEDGLLYKYLPFVAMMMAINLLDSIPNSSINNITLLMAGMLAGSVHATTKNPSGTSRGIVKANGPD